METPIAKAAPPDLAAALDRLWAKFLPEMGERVATIDAAVKALAAGWLSAGEKDAAASAAHKLAGVLGTFSLARGTELAREMELAFSGAPESASHLASIAAELRHLIESRGQ